MAAMTTVVKALIKADASQMKTQLQGASRSLDDFSKSAKETGRKLTRRLTLPLIGAGATAIKAASDFEASMTKIESLVGLSSEAVQGFTQDVRRLSGETAQAPKDLADAMFFITSAGLRGADATETLEAAAKAAAVGLGETAVIADLATSALNAYGAENLSATQATDVMVAAVREGKLNADELAVSMGRVLPLASAMGVNFNEVGAAFAALSRTGTNASEAATQVRGILSSLLRPTKQARDALAGMGLSAEGLREELRQKGLLATLKTLSKEFAGNEAAAASVFGNIRALSGVLDLMGANVATTEQIFANMTDTTGTLDKAFEATSETAAFKLSQAMANLKGAFIDIGNVLIPIVVPILENLAGIIKTLGDGFGKLPSPIQKTAVAIGLLGAAAGPAAYSVGLLTGKGGRAGLGGLLKMVKAHPAAFIAAGAAVTIFGGILKSQRDAAREAKERMESLRQEMIDAGDPTVTLTERIKELASALHGSGGVDEGAEATEEAIGNLGIGVKLLQDELTKAGLLGAFEATGLSLEEVAKLAQTGTDGFQGFASVFGTTLRTALRRADKDVIGVTNTLANLNEAGELTDFQVNKLTRVFDEVADASDDVRASVEAEAKAYLESGETLRELNRIYGKHGTALLDQAQSLDTATEGQEFLEEKLQASMEAQKEAERITRSLTVHTDEFAEAQRNARANTEEVTQRFRTFNATSKLTAEELQEVRDEFDKLVRQLNDVVENAFGFDSALLQVKETAVTLVEAIAGLNDEEKTQLEREAELLRASERYANALAGVGEELVGLPVEEVNGFFAEQKTVLDDAFRSGELAEEEYRRLTSVLSDLEQQVIDLNKRDALIKIGVDTSGVPQSFINLLFGADGEMDIGGFAASVAAGFTPMATGGVVTQPTLGLIGEAGPEAVIPLDRLGSTSGGHSTINITVQDADPTAVVNAIEKYVRENGSAPVATSTFTRK